MRSRFIPLIPFRWLPAESLRLVDSHLGDWTAAPGSVRVIDERSDPVRAYTTDRADAVALCPDDRHHGRFADTMAEADGGDATKPLVLILHRDGSRQVLGMGVVG